MKASARLACLIQTSLPTVLLIFISLAAHGSSVVLGSYGSEASARQRQIQLERQTGQPLVVSSVDVKTRRVFRVHTPEEANLLLVRRQEQSLKDRGFSDAWVSLTESIETTSTPQAPVATPAALPAIGSPAKRATTTFPVAESQKNTSPVLLARARTDALTDAKNFEPGNNDEIPATSLPLNLPKFDNVDLVIDGRLDDAIWDQVPGYDNMRVIDPDTLGRTSHRTVNKIFYTNKGLYVGVMAEQPHETLIARLTSRDQDINRDGTFMNLDPTGEGRYGFFFGVNLGGSVSDGTILPEMQFSREWDGAWYSGAVETDYGYSTEMFIPWSIMAMPEGSDLRKMGFYVSRKVAYLDERWGWPTIPYTRGRFMSVLQPIELKDVNPGQQLAFYPFAATTYDNIRGESDYRAGADVFWRPSTNLQLTATLNPDFGSVESDDVVVNLTAFETFFPEKRLFFLEGSDIFVTSPRSNVRRMTGGGTGARNPMNTYVPEPTTLVNTRRIGGPALTPELPAGADIADVELGKPTELLGAVKATGQLGSLRYGVMGALEDDTTFYGTNENGTPTRIMQDGRDFGVMRLLYENVNQGRKSVGLISTLVSHPDLDAMTHGIDAHYVHSTGKFSWDGQLVHSDVDDVTGSGGWLDLSYIPKRGIFHRVSLDYFDEDLNVTDFGFLRRNDLRGFRYNMSYMRSNLSYFRSFSSYVSIGRELNNNSQVIRNGIFFHNSWTFPDQSRFDAQLAYFDPFWDDLNSEGHGAYRVKRRRIAEFSYGTNTSRPLSASISTQVFDENIGDQSTNSTLGFTWKPNDRFSLDMDLNYRRRDNWLIHLSGPNFGTYEATDLQPRIAMDVFLTARQQLRFTMQWAGIKARATELYRIPDGDGAMMSLGAVNSSDYDFTISRITTQLRYRWEIAPLSDLFLVYTRGSNLPNQVDDEFGNLFNDALTDPVIDVFVAKLRYRFAK